MLFAIDGDNYFFPEIALAQTIKDPIDLITLENNVAVAIKAEFQLNKSIHDPGFYKC